MNQLKVVHITETFVTGVYSYIKDLSLELDKKNYLTNTIIFSNKREGRLNEPLPQSIQLLELDMVREINFKEDYLSFIKLLKLLKKIKPDVVHLHSSKAGFLGRLCCVFLKDKPKVFYTPHGFSFLRTDISKLKKFAFFSLEKMISLFSDSTIIACGDTEFMYAKKIGNSFLVRNGVDFENITAHYLPYQENEIITIGILGRISFPRNPELFNKIALCFPDLRFLWIGGGELEDKLTAPNIEVTGWFAEKEQGFKYLNKVDIYIQTSLWEGLPIAVLEAMAFKKPIVASNVIGNKDAVVHDETGFLFNNFNEACFYINKLIINKDIRTKFGNKGFERCKTYFNTNQNFRELIDYYKYS